MNKIKAEYFFVDNITNNSSRHITSLLTSYSSLYFFYVLNFMDSIQEITEEKEKKEESQVGVVGRLFQWKKREREI